MDVSEAIEKRRAYRSLSPVEITSDIIQSLANAARFAPSCFNMQPWNYVFVHEPGMLEKMHSAFSQGNEWAQRASMIIAVFSEPESDCIIRDREYYLFDTGMATSQLILQATELGLVAHPIAGFSPRKVRKILDIPDDKMVIALIIVGNKSEDASLMTEQQVDAEKERPARKPVDDWLHINKYNSRN